MSESSEDNKKNKETIEPVTVKVEESEESSSSSRKDDDDDVYFPSNIENIQKLNFISNTTSSKPTNNNLETLDSDRLHLKKNLFRSNSLQKSDNKKASEALSTSRGSDKGSFIRVRNYNSPRKRYSVFKLIEKDKRYKKDINSLFFDQKKNNSKIEKEKVKVKERTDIYGNIINKKNKRKVKVSFIDRVTEQPLVKVIEIKSYKNFNYIEGLPKEEKLGKVKTICVCCSIF
jgi:hypothetical protein